MEKRYDKLIHEDNPSKYFLKEESRNIFLDIVKGIAIILVVIGHCIQCGSGADFLLNDHFFANTLFKVIYSFHMPLFSVVSGYLFYISASKRNTEQVIIRQIKSIIIPNLCWSLLYQIIKLFFAIFLKHQKFDAIWFLKLIKYCMTNLWFLWAVFWCSLIVSLTKKLFNDSIVVYVVGFVASQFLPNAYNLSFYAYVYPFFICAYLFNKYEVMKKIRVRKGLLSYIFIFSAIVWCFMLLLYDNKHYIYTTGIFILKENILSQISINAFRYGIAIFGCITILSFVWFIFSLSPSTDSILAFIGTKTIGIYIISSYLNIYFLQVITTSFYFNYFIMIIETVAMLFITISATLVIEKFKIARRFLLGGR